PTWRQNQSKVTAMADGNGTEKVTLKTASGELVDVIVPSGMSDDQIRAMARQRMPEEFAPEALSQQEIQNLIDTRSKLPQGHPRADKIDQFLLQKYPATFQGMNQSNQRQMAASQPGAYQTRRGGPIQNLNDTSGQVENNGYVTIVPKENEDFQD